MAVRAVIFDLFDTLVDLHMENLRPYDLGGRKISGTVERLHAVANESASVPFQRFAEMLGDVDAQLWQERVREGLELPTIERFSVLCERLGIVDASLPHRLTETHMGALHEQVGMPEGHAAVLKTLSEGVSLALCSNFTHGPKAREILDEYELAPHLDVVVVSDEVGIRKPRAEIFEATLEALGVEAAEAIHVGDNLSADVAGAGALGIRTVWITRRVQDPAGALEAWDGKPPDEQIAELGELLPLLGREG